LKTCLNQPFGSSFNSSNMGCFGHIEGRMRPYGIIPTLKNICSVFEGRIVLDSQDLQKN
jgi:hypothetical protein